MEKKDGYINVSEILKAVLSKKKLFLISLPIAIVVSSLIIICVPRSYTSSAMLVPEVENPMDMGSVGSLASSFGIDLNHIGGTDAISPLLYPELLNDNGFVASLLKIQVKTQDGTLKCSTILSLSNSTVRSIASIPPADIAVSLLCTNISPQQSNVTIGVPAVKAVDTPLQILYLATVFILTSCYNFIFFITCFYKSHCFFYSFIYF